MLVQHVAERAATGVILDVEALPSEPASRNASELDSSSSHKCKVTSLPEWVKSAANGEVTGKSSHWAFRGDWRQRVGKDWSRNLGDPAWRFFCANTEWENITILWLCRESEGLIVAEKPWKQDGAKEPPLLKERFCKRGGIPIGRAYYGKSDNYVASSLFFETETGPKGQAGTEVSLLFFV